MAEQPEPTGAPAGTATDPAPGAPEEYPPGQDPRRWRALSVCLVAGFMALLDVSIVNVALPSLRSGLSASPSDLQWVSAGYALALGLILVGAGRLGDVRGRRRVFVVAVCVFTLASAMCGLAPSVGWLIAARLLQGIGGGLMMPQVSGFIQELFRGPERGRAFGLMGASIGLSTAVGPLAGGALIALFGTQHGWRAVFFVNVPIGLAAVPLALRLLPPARASRRWSGVDPVGVVLLGAAVLALLLPLVEVRDWPGAGKWLLLVAAVPLLALFLGWERSHQRRGREPMISLALFRVRSYALGTALGTVYFAGFTAIFFVLAIFLQTGRGYSALQSGVAVTPFAVGSGLAAAFGGRIVARYGRRLVAVGLTVMIVGLVATTVAIGQVSGRSVGWATALPLLVTGVGSGVVISPNVTLTLSEVPVARAGSAGGVLQTGQRLGGAVGIAAVGSLFFTRLTDSHGDWTSAVRAALLLCAATCTLALLLALTDLRRRPARVAAES